MSPSKKPVKIILFHANRCGHCVDFLPTWEKMKSDKNANKNIEFEQYEESIVKDLPEDVRSIDGVDVRTNGWPTIKISVNGRDHMYSGNRTPDDIYKYILAQLKGKDLDKPVRVDLDGPSVKISTNRDDILQTLSDMHEGDSIEGDSIEGGSKKKKHANSLLEYDDLAKNSKRLISSSDFKSLNDDTHFSDAFRVIRSK